MRNYKLGILGFVVLLTNLFYLLPRQGNADETQDLRIQRLIQDLRDKDSSVRRGATKALGRMGAEAKGAVPVLNEVLKDQDAVVRSNAAEALGNIGSEASGAIPALKEALKDKDSFVRRNAEKALKNIKRERKNSAVKLKEPNGDPAEGYVVVIATFDSIERADKQKQELSVKYDNIRIKTIKSKHIVMVAGFDKLTNARTASQDLVGQFKDCFIATYKEPTRIIDKPEKNKRQKQMDESDEDNQGWSLGWIGYLVIGISVLAILGFFGADKCPKCKSTKIENKSSSVVSQKYKHTTKSGQADKRYKKNPIIQTVENGWVCRKCSHSWKIRSTRTK